MVHFLEEAEEGTGIIVLCFALDVLYVVISGMGFGGRRGAERVAQWLYSTARCGGVFLDISYRHIRVISCHRRY